jgi:hypothetical protein
MQNTTSRYYISALTLFSLTLPRLWRVGQVNHRKADEDNTSKWIFSRRAALLSQHHIQERTRLGPRHCHGNAKNRRRLPTTRKQSTYLIFLIFSVSPLNQANAEAIYEYRIEHTPNFVFSESIAAAIKQLWQDPIIPTVMDHSSEFYLMDSAA